MFEPPDWPLFLAVVGALLLTREVVGLFRYALKRVRPVGAAFITLVAIIAGPALVVLGIFLGVMTASTRMEKHLRGFTGLVVGSIGTLVAAMGWLIWVWPREGSLVTIAVCASLWAVRSYAKTTSPLPRVKKNILLALRIVIILLLTGWVMRPTLRTVRYETYRPVVLFGVDTSQSMLRSDMPPNFKQESLSANQEPITRIAAALQGFTRFSYLLDSLADQYDLQWFAFSSSPTPAAAYRPNDEAFLKSLFSTTPGGGTAIGDSLQTVFDPFVTSNQSVQSVVVISDGCNNMSAKITPEKFASRMNSRGVGVYTVGVGSEKVIGETCALSVRTTGSPDKTRAFGKMLVKPSVECIGLQGRTIEVTCSFAGEQIGSQTREITSLRSVEEFEFSHVPINPGFHRLVVRGEVVGKTPPRLAGKLEMQKLVQVTDHQMRVLYVEGKFRYESKYIAKALGGGEFLIDRRIILDPIGEEPNAQNQLGDTLKDWMKYHAIIFGDVSPEHFTRNQLEIIKRVVGEYGKGFCMIGGNSSFGAGGWDKTPIADIMPVDLSRSTQQISNSVRPLPSVEGAKSELMRLDPGSDDISAVWSQLPPLPGANLLVGVKPTATIIAETQQGEPMIVQQNYGKGRTMGIAFDTTWRWVLSPSKQDTQKMQQRFWQQVVLYLAAPKGNIWIHTNRTGYDFDLLKRGVQEVVVTAGVEDPRGKPITDLETTTMLIAPDGGKQDVIFDRQEHLLRGILPPLREVGVYRLEIKGVVDGKELSAEHRFEVTLQDIEAGEVLANFGLLKRMAEAGGGEFHHLWQLEKLLANLKETVRSDRHRSETVVDIMTQLRWSILIALIVLLCTEWALRKHSGLV
ncbi:MAG: VWA domain-containing protein [Phycisphaerae bacterium]|nr:VWA domain-containing protein [Phycisphaerae bacterium]